MTNLIVTISDYTNYGNRLQNYALSRLLSDNYGETTTVRFQTRLPTFRHKLIRNGRKIAGRIRTHIVRGERLLTLQRTRKCLAFTRKYIPDDRFTLTDYSGLKAAHGDIYDRVIIGSDQIWNYNWINRRDLELALGSFTPVGCPVISYAASFGISSIDEDAQAVFKQYLPKLKAISVREFRGAELVKEMTGLDATVVLDPTLMLTANDWKTITEGFVPKDDKYVLTYFLGHPSDEQERNIQEYAKKHGCRIRRILDMRDPQTYLAGPQDFVELFSKAEYVFTDSYHACCFSMLFHKQFTVFNRANMTGKSSMNSRMETLFRLFDLESVMIDAGLAPTIDYENVDRLLAAHRERSGAWLAEAMHD